MNLKKIGKVFTSKFVGTGPSSYKKKNLPGRGLTKVEKHCCKLMEWTATQVLVCTYDVCTCIYTYIFIYLLIQEYIITRITKEKAINNNGQSSLN
jgi:hypothetical protein